MQIKDEFTIIQNPNNIFFPFEVWCRGEKKDWTGVYMRSIIVTECISYWRTEEKAKAVVKYWQDIQEFKKEEQQ